MSTPTSAAVVVQVIKDRGAKTDAAALNGRGIAGSGKTSSGQNFIRRPTSGLQIKDETFATIRLVAMVDGSNRAIVDAGSRRRDGDNKPIEVNGKRATDIYSNFLLQAVSEERAEKSQVLETFGEPYIFLFGERPRMVSFQGILVNSFDFNWESEWWYNYEEFLRGTRCVETDARVYIQYDTVLVGGYILAANAARNANEPYHVNFSFQLFVTSYNNFSDIGNPNAMPGFPIDVSTFDGKNVSTENKVQAAALLQVTRPVLIPSISPGVESVNVSPFGIEMPSLFDAFSDRVKEVESVWTQASDLVNSVSTKVAGALDPQSIRVPAGFAGQTGFDLSSQVVLGSYADPFMVDVIKYSVFSNNEEEYVGSGSHYGSSNITFGDFGWQLPESNLSTGQDMYGQATVAWQDAGYPDPFAQAVDLFNQAKSQVSDVVSTGQGIAEQAAGIAMSGAAALQAEAESVATQANDLLRSMSNGDLGLLVTGMKSIAPAGTIPGSAQAAIGAGISAVLPKE